MWHARQSWWEPKETSSIWDSFKCITTCPCRTWNQPCVSIFGFAYKLLSKCIDYMICSCISLLAGLPSARIQGNAEYSKNYSVFLLHGFVVVACFAMPFFHFVRVWRLLGWCRKQWLSFHPLEGRLPSLWHRFYAFWWAAHREIH